MATSTRWLGSPVTRPAHSPSIVAWPSSSRPSSRKNAIVAGRSSTTMPTLSIRCTVIRSRPSVSAGRPRRRRVAHHETGRELDVERLELVPLEEPSQEADGRAPHLRERLADCRERRRDDRRVLDVVEADDRHVLWNAKPAVTGGPDGPDG